MSADLVYLSESNSVPIGLRDMVEAAIGPHEDVTSYVDAPIALYIIEIARRAEDNEKWFPRGKWATIQNIQRAIDAQLAKLWGRP